MKFQSDCWALLLLLRFLTPFCYGQTKRNRQARFLNDAISEIRAVEHTMKTIHARKINRIHPLRIFHK